MAKRLLIHPFKTDRSSVISLIFGSVCLTSQATIFWSLWDSFPVKHNPSEVGLNQGPLANFTLDLVWLGSDIKLEKTFKGFCFYCTFSLYI